MAGHAVCGFGLRPSAVAGRHFPHRRGRLAFQTNAVHVGIRERAAGRVSGESFVGLGLSQPCFGINSGAEANEKCPEARVQNHGNAARARGAGNRAWHRPATAAAGGGHLGAPSASGTGLSTHPHST